MLRSKTVVGSAHLLGATCTGMLINAGAHS